MFSEEIIYFRNAVATSVKSREDLTKVRIKAPYDFPQLVSTESQTRIHFQ